MKNSIHIALLLTAAILMTACGNSKSKTSPSDQSSSGLNLSTKPLAQCNKTADSNLSFNTSIVSDQNGKISTEWIKFKFNFINSEITKSGNVLKFFKWRISNGQTILSEIPLQISAYDFTSGQTVSEPYSALPADQVNGAQGFYINLEDPNSLFQVIKVVAYNSEGKVIANVNSLIPSFYANPADYQLNADGTARAALLQNLHPLKNVSVTGWTADQFTQSFSQYCF